MARQVKPLDPEAATNVLDRELARRSLSRFVKLAWPVLMPVTPYADNWHVGVICEHLEAMTRGEIDKLIINLPPRHTKSLLVSVFWPAWVWASNPGFQWLYISYDDHLVERDAMRCRDLVRSLWYKKLIVLDPWEIKAGSDTKEYYQNTKNGARISTTPESLGTGADADGVVVDDAHHVREAHQPKRLEFIGDWFRQTMTTRGNNPNTFFRLVTHQRVADRDLSGQLLADELGYEHLCIPTHYNPARVFFTFEEAKAAHVENPIVLTKLQRERPETRDPRTEPGELLWPARFGEAKVREQEADLLAGKFAQLEQDPRKRTGEFFQTSLFRRTQLVRRAEGLGILLKRTLLNPGDVESEQFIPLEDLRFFQTADTASTESTSASWTVLGTFAFTPYADLIVWNVWRIKLEVPYQFAAVLALRNGPCRWNPDRKRMEPVLDPSKRPRSWPGPILFQAVENKSSGIGLIQAGAAFGKPFKVLNTGTRDKVERAAVAAGLYYAGKVYHLDQPWAAILEDELGAFPAGAATDQVDVVSYASYLLQHDMILRSYLRRDLISGYTQDGPVIEPPNEHPLTIHDNRGGETVIRPEDWM